MPTTTKGSDLLIHLVGNDAMPEATIMLEKWSMQDVKNEFGEDTNVYLWNKNLQNLPSRVRGGLIYLPKSKIVGFIVQSEGYRALVSILFPLSKRGVEVPITDLRTDGYYLQQVQGVVVQQVDQGFRSQDIIPETGHVVTLHDTKGCIKVDIEGPDVVCVESRKISKEVRNFLKEGDVTRLNRGKLPKPKRQKTSGIATVPVVYVFNPQGNQYTSVDRCVDHKGKITGTYSVPIGGRIESESSR